MSTPWIVPAPHAPYFVTESGEDWIPIGQNDAITWPDLEGLYRRRDLASVERYLAYLSDHGVNTMRLMMEYCQTRHRFFEKRVGVWNPSIIQLWDDLFAMCPKYGIRILLTPFDTFWMWINWKHHAYNTRNGGFCDHPSKLLLLQETLNAANARLAFATERWGGSGTLFAWDLWNEIHPSYAKNSAAPFEEFIGELSRSLRAHEMRVHGRAHPQTVSIFSPHIMLDKHIPDAIYRHPELDFTSTHLYEAGAIDHPKNTVDAAVRFGFLTRVAIEESPVRRPYVESEHGPIHTYKDHHITLPADFDDEYFGNMQWAHVAAGGCGGGMRWPNRNPHGLTHGMREAQRSLARFQPLIRWQCFDRKPSDPAVPGFHSFACASHDQAILYLLRKDTLDERGMMRTDVPGLDAEVAFEGMAAGCYTLTRWDTRAGEAVSVEPICHEGAGPLRVTVRDVVRDAACALTRKRA